jgi:hypothetical protein
LSRKAENYIVEAPTPEIFETNFLGFYVEVRFLGFDVEMRFEVLMLK